MWLGERLKSLREEHGLSQKDLGEKIDMTRATISKYENSPEELDTYRTLVAMSEVFNVPTDYLLGLTDCRERYPAPEPFKGIDMEEMFQDLSPDMQKKAAEYIEALVKAKEKSTKK